MSKLKNRPFASPWKIQWPLRLLRLHFVVALVAMFALACTSTAIFQGSVDAERAEVVFHESIYGFDPYTILGDLASGGSQLFVEESPLATSESPSEQILFWTTREHYLVAERFHEFKFEESVSNWGLERVTFQAFCRRVEEGFYKGSFSLFRIPEAGNVTMRHEITVSLTSQAVSSWIEEASQIRGSILQQPIDRGTIHAGALQALAVAEANGGEAIRESINNECEVDLMLAPGGAYLGWQVFYFGNSPIPLLRIRVDPNTWEIEKPSD